MDPRLVVSLHHARLVDIIVALDASLPTGGCETRAVKGQIGGPCEHCTHLSIRIASAANTLCIPTARKWRTMQAYAPAYVWVATRCLTPWLIVRNGGFARGFTETCLLKRE